MGGLHEAGEVGAHAPGARQGSDGRGLEKDGRFERPADEGYAYTMRLARFRLDKAMSSKARLEAEFAKTLLGISVYIRPE